MISLTIIGILITYIFIGIIVTIIAERYDKTFPAVKEDIIIFPILLWPVVLIILIFSILPNFLYYLFNKTKNILFYTRNDISAKWEKK